MPDPDADDRDDAERLGKQIGAAERRKLKAKRQHDQSIWFGLGMIGLVGWSVAVPALLGVALGVWLDSVIPGRASWTLMMLLAGIATGSLNAWYWLVRQHRQIEGDEKEDIDD